ncbi:MAG: DUF995 domain-containing protein [Alphaproteobacteria bacterium]|nr:DUF995 domain-containing protein [Alphaproteobacteria bacterium]
MNKLVLLLAAVIACVHSLPAVAASKFVLPKKAHNLSPGEVRKIYADHTWVWGQGGAYFGPNSKFIAVGIEGKNVSVATGRWLVTKGGRLCFDAYWSGRKFTGVKALTCFNHAQFNGQIFQAKGMSGKWYTIKSAAAKPDDMLNQVVAGDQVTCKFIDTAHLLKGHLSKAQLLDLAHMKKAGAACAAPKKEATT